MGKVLVIVTMVFSLVLGSNALIAHATGDGHFHCSVCGSHDHGSLWHDSDKDGKNDR